MDNKGFEVIVNNGKPIRIGFESSFYSLTCIVSSTKRRIEPKEVTDIVVGGLNSENNQYVRWIEEELKIGDKVSIEVISDTFDSPKRIIRQDSEELLLQSKLKAYHALREELKEYL